MKKISMIISIFLLMVFIPCVKAESKLTLIGAEEVKVGRITNIYVRVDTDRSITKISLKYAVKGGLNLYEGNELGKLKATVKKNDITLTSDKEIASGTGILVMSVKGMKEGDASLVLSDITVTMDGKEVKLENATHNLKVTKVDNETTLSEEADLIQLNKATILVESAEKSLAKDDYDAAYEAINFLGDSQEKEELLTRLETVKYNITVKETCPSSEKTDCKKTNCSKAWLLVSLGLGVVLIGETIILLIKKKEEE